MKIKVEIIIETRSQEVVKYVMENYNENVMSCLSDSQDDIGFTITIETGPLGIIPDEISELKKALEQ